MAQVHVVYKYKELDAAGKYWKPEKTLCFICATRAAVDYRNSTNSTKIYTETTEYEASVCDQCDSFIEDTIDI